ncbi:sensor histidine kinase [Sandaracinus amylolyticus]|uniref:histidine kinase n=1 Tax=Sandaracinus amylolyticus TaxID=927083 RepID=A0A0F6SGD6_9BACT|nr:protoglobin domain-containing protein [Sandaracinus amylolyticus]AKF08509.1 Two-component sensor PilS [Sandaracinus amylolyticus]
MAATSDMLRELFDYVGFGDEDARWLVRMGPAVRPAFPHIVDEFYRTIDDNAGARAVFTGGPAQRARLHASMHAWLEGVVSGIYDEGYFEQRARIGRMHVRIDLDQRYMMAAMNVIRRGLHDALRAAQWPADEQIHGHDAIDKICDIELAVMLETYRESYVEKQRANERLATIGQLAASIGHELRNPLAVMETSLHLLSSRQQAERGNADDKAARHLHRIREQLAISGAIISDLLEMARDRAPDRRPVDVRALIDEALASVPRPEQLRVEVAIDEALPRASVDPVQLRQVVVNLVLNASQAIAGAKREGVVKVHAQREGDELVLVIEDDGPGLSTEAVRRLFEPLFTTRATGVGLGLPLCRRIVEKHGGTIRGYNLGQPDAPEGARFEIRLPGALAVTGAPS